MTRLGVPSSGGISLLSAFILLLSTGQVFSSGKLNFSFKHAHFAFLLRSTESVQELSR